ncbi:hypothetical protein GCM10009779_13790 [Polymorphospora rubra]|uniref:Uncharacterized protein n=1 Tax=Polymorphospora rubra TaxID=338584 RepID=A0A810MWH5_9ACTN|nr:hypothetical protein Prubr_13500 [Polymorphospora rubra]
MAVVVTRIAVGFGVPPGTVVDTLRNEGTPAAGCTPSAARTTAYDPLSGTGRRWWVAPVTYLEADIHHAAAGRVPTRAGPPPVE